MDSRMWTERYSKIMRGSETVVCRTSSVKQHMKEIINIFMKKLKNKKNTPHEIKERKL
jgi:hypothetical protein